MMCAWNPNSKKIDFKQALKWEPTFHYQGNVLCPSPYLTQQCYKSANSTNAIATFASSLQETNGIETIEVCLSFHIKIVKSDLFHTYIVVCSFIYTTVVNIISMYLSTLVDEKLKVDIGM